MIAHWDVETARADLGHLAAAWTDLADATGARRIGVNGIRIDAGKWSTPAHIETAAEETFFVLRGSGFSWQRLGAAGEPRMHDVRAGDCIVHRAGEETHTLIGGPDGLDVLLFGERSDPPLTWLPRPRVVCMGISFHLHKICFRGVGVIARLDHIAYEVGEESPY